MRSMKKTSEILFRAVGLLFSAVLIILSLLCSIRLAAVNDTAAGLERQAEQLKTQNEILRAEYENSLSLEEIERYATDVLGMQRCSPGQIFYLELPDEETDK